MKRAVPWIISAIAIIAFGASFSELQRMRGRFSEVTRHQFHDHRDVRQFIIKAALIGLDQPIIVLGDSITEMARLPEAIDEKPVVNAGIGGANIEDTRAIVPILLEDSKPSIIAVALGTNDAGSNTIRRDYAALLSQLKKYSPHLLAVAMPPQADSDVINAQIKAAAESEGIPFLEMPLPDGSTLPDHVHLNAAGYRKWTPALVSAISGHSS